MRFQKGEPAIFAVAANPGQIPCVGKECTVDEVGPFSVGQIIVFKGELRRFDRACDYICMFDAEHGVIAQDWQLRKINPPEEPEAMTRTSDIDEEITA